MNLDAIDRAILYLLQEESRTHLTHDEIGDRIGVSSSTVSNRLQSLKERGVLQDYRPVIDYEAADIPHHLLFVCTAPIVDRESICERTVDAPGVVNVRALLTGSRNLHVEVVATDSSDVESVAEALDAEGTRDRGVGDPASGLLPAVRPVRKRRTRVGRRVTRRRSDRACIRGQRPEYTFSAGSP